MRARADAVRTLRTLALLGGESSGKTALAAQLHTAWVPEYGRQRWEEVRETLSVEEVLGELRDEPAGAEPMPDADERA